MRVSGRVSGRTRRLSPWRAGAHLRTFRRTALSAVVVGATCLGITVSGATTASADDSSWVPGTAQATSTAIALHPTTGGLGYTIKLATSIADYADQEAQAQSQTFDGGAIVLALTSTQCDGSNPAVPSSQLPPAAQAESNSGNTSQDLALQGLNSNGVGAGDEHAAATTQPDGTAVTHLADISVPGVISIAGGASSADAAQVSGKTRTATSTADVGQVSLGGGLVSLNGLHWETTQQTGPNNAVTQSTGSFTMSTITVAGITTPVNADNLNTVLGIANTALAPTGLHIGPLPTLQVNPQNRATSVPPLAIGIDNSALGNQIVGPVLGQSATETVRDAIVGAILGVSCTYGTEITVGDILLGVTSGGGNFDIELGGVNAVSDGTYIANPFSNSLGLLGANSVVDDTSGTFTPGTSSSYTPGTAGDLGALGTTGAGATTGGAGTVGAVSRTLHCLTTSPFGHPGCSGGAALPVGLIGLGVVTTMGIADFARARRMRRVLPQEEID
jgi:collagen type I alpha